MENYRFQKAAASRRFVAWALAILFHLALFAAFLAMQESSETAAVKEEKQAIIP